jgi:putative membrane-bound dehydrogenase-like protein
MEPGPRSPEDSLKCIKTRPGFKVELMVAEPLVMDPVAFAWGPDGKFWVVEMGDYPLGIDGKNKFGGKIKFLEKTRPDGPYDKMTLFMDNVGYPTGVFPYKNGVLVTCAPDIFYAEMGKDGKVKKEVVFTGFKEGNQQHRVNGLTWGIDNWIYGANGDSGGVIEGGKLAGLLERKMMKGSVNISGRDFRFKVETGEFEAVSGQSQFGRCRDDWGNWFGCNNSNPMFHFVLEDRYLKRNPHVLYPDVRVPVVPGAVRVYPISKPLPRFNTPQGLNHFTSACSTIIYRDTLFGKEFEGNAFIAEPVHNLVHRVIVKPKGVTFTAQRADDEKESEFLASTDNWFRPAMIQVGPDGALWIADMYRYVIEHPEWIPKDWQKKLDLRAGHDKGRIYRVYPVDKKPRDIVRMDKMTAGDLVKQLEHPNGWVRDTAHQLLVLREHKIPALQAACKGTRELATEGKTPQARLHAMLAGHWLHDGWEAKVLLKFLKDPHPAVRKHCIAMTEQTQPFIWITTMDALAKEESEQVRQQVGYSLAYADSGGICEQNLSRLLLQNADNPYILAAGLSSIAQDNWRITFAILSQEKRLPSPLFNPLMRLAKAYGKPGDPGLLVVRQLGMLEKKPTGDLLAPIADLLDALQKNDISLVNMLKDGGEKEIDKTIARLKEVHDHAVKVVQSPKASTKDKALAIRVLGLGLGNDREDHKILLDLLTPQAPDDFQSLVIVQLSRQSNASVPRLLLTPWKSYSPALRGQVLDTLFSQQLWTTGVLDAIKQKQVPAAEIDAVRRQRLLTHRDKQIRDTAAKLFAGASDPDRGKVVDRYWLSLPDKTDVQRGAKLYAKACASCHKLGDTGQNVGPDLASVGDKSVQGLLNAILDPNRALESRYVNYVASTKGGKSYNGIITGETSTSITLVGPDGKTQQLLRNELDELTSTGKSLMPDGLEKDLSPQDVADIIEYVRSNQQLPKRKVLEGNVPKTVAAGKDGVFRLLPATAAVYGKTIVIEKQYGNFGYWSSPDDEVVWTIDVPKAGEYAVWIYYACANDSAGNTAEFFSVTGKLTYKVVSTGSWDEYRGRNIGTLDLKSGPQWVRVRGVGAIRGALFDLKKVELSPR